MNESLSKYAEAVAELANSKRPNLMHNEGDSHALIIFTNIFNTAEDYVKIVARNLANEEVANNPLYIEALKSFLGRKNTTLSILLSEYDQHVTPKLPLFEMIKSTKAYRDGRVDIAYTGGRHFTSSDNNEIHFCVADDRIFRLETDVNARKAICNFKDEEIVSKLNESFTSARNSATTMHVEL